MADKVIIIENATGKQRIIDARAWSIMQQTGSSKKYHLKPVEVPEDNPTSIFAHEGEVKEVEVAPAKRGRKKPE